VISTFLDRDSEPTFTSTCGKSRSLFPTKSVYAVAEDTSLMKEPAARVPGVLAECVGAPSRSE